MKTVYLSILLLLTISFGKAQEFNYLSPTTGEVETYSSIEEFNSKYQPKSSAKGISKNTIETLSSCTLTAPIESQAEINALSSCTSIDGSLIIRGSLITDGNSSITDLSPLNNLTSVRLLFEISDLPSVTEFPSFTNLTEVGADLFILNLSGLTTVPSFPNLTNIGGVLTLQQLPIASLIEFPNLTSVGGVTIIGNAQITSVDGFNALTSVTNAISIQSNANLEEVNGFNSLTSAGTFLYAFNNSTTELNGFDNITSLNRLAIAIINQSFDVTAFSKLESLGFLQLQNIQLDNIDFLSSVTELGFGINITNSPLLTNLGGLDNVVFQGGFSNTAGDTQINNNINISNCPALASLGSMDLTSTSHFSSINIVNTPNLTNVSALNGVGGDVESVNISNTDVQNLNFLSNISKITNNINISFNSNLTDITGISSLDVSELESLQITNNNLLDECNIASVCELVGLAADPANNPDLTVFINDNNTNCANISIVESACGICAPGSKFITNQAEVDNFTCTVVDGDLYIEPSTPQGITNLDGLSVLTEVTGSLYIIGTNITSVDGLENLTSIGVDIAIGDNPLLTNLNALSNLTSVSGVSHLILNNTSLTNISGIANINMSANDNLRIENNTSLAECEIASVCSLLGLNPNNVNILNNASGCDTKAEVTAACQALVPQCPTGSVVLATQAEVDDFVAQYPNCTEIDGDLFVGNFGANPPVNDITDISGLNSIESVANTLGIFRTSLTTLASFDNLTSVTGIEIRNNPELATISGFNNLTTSDAITMFDNVMLSNVSGFNAIESTNTIQLFYSQPATATTRSITGFTSLETVLGILHIGGQQANQINDISGFSSLENVGLLYVVGTQLTDLSILDGVTIEAQSARLQIENNPLLTSLPNLNFVGPVTETVIAGNPLLTDLTGLENLTKSNVWIENNAGLTSLNGLQGLQESNKWVPSAVGVRIINNQNLTNLDALSNLEDLDDLSIRIINNANITDISGLDNVSFTTVDQLNISGNANLATCESLMVCNFLSAYPSKATISSNATGCNSVAEVQAACQPLSINEFTSNDIKVYPNPFVDNIEVKLPAGIQNAKLRLMSLTGKVIYSSSINSSTSTIKGIEKLNSGLYLLQVELETGQKLTYKVIK